MISCLTFFHLTDASVLETLLLFAPLLHPLMLRQKIVPLLLISYISCCHFSLSASCVYFGKSVNLSIPRSCLCNSFLRWSNFLLSTPSSTCIFHSSSSPLFPSAVLHWVSCPFSGFFQRLSSSRNSRICLCLSEPPLGDEDPGEYPPAVVDTACLCFLCKPDGMFVWHPRHLRLVHTFAFEQNLQIHSLRPSIATASAKIFSARICAGIQPFLFCVRHPSPFVRSSAPVDWRKYDETAAVKPQTTRSTRKAPQPRLGHKHTNTQTRKGKLEP